jgi:tellurite resistance protein
MSGNEPNKTFLEFLPVSLFGSIMGLTGLSFAWKLAGKSWGYSIWPGILIGVLAISFFLILSITYIVKWFRYPATVKAEFNHPVSVSFFTTFIVCLLLIPGIILPYYLSLAIGLWIIGAVLVFIFAFIRLRTMFFTTQEPSNALPSWLLPIVGIIDVPIVGYSLPIPGIHEICLIYFGIGVVLTLIFMPIVFSRLLFQPALPEALQPTLLFLVAPLAISFTDFELLSGSQDMLASVFYYATLFVLLIFGTKVLLLPRCCPFRVGWWAVSFPLVATTIASFRYASHKSSSVYQLVPTLLLIISTVTIFYLLVQTLYRIASNKLFLTNLVSEKATQTMEPLFRKENAHPQL